MKAEISPEDGLIFLIKEFRHAVRSAAQPKNVSIPNMILFLGLNSMVAAVIMPPHSSRTAPFFIGRLLSEKQNPETNIKTVHMLRCQITHGCETVMFKGRSPRFDRSQQK